MYGVMWKLISVLLGLVAFMVVCISSMLAGDELLSSTLKAIVSFFVLWIFFSLVGAIFTRVVPTGEEEEFASYVSETTGQTINTTQSNIPTVDDDGLPSIEAGPELGKAA